MDHSPNIIPGRFARTPTTGRSVSHILRPGMILPSKEAMESIAIEDHASEPIKSLEDIERIRDYLVSHERWRDNMLFIVGINFGLRVSDLLRLRFGDLINDNLTFKTSFPILERKTANTRKVKKNRSVTINEAVMDAVSLYLEHRPSRLEDYMFRSEAGKDRGINRPMDRYSVERILKKTCRECGITVHVATHTLRKTFGYHQMRMSGNDPRKLMLLCKIFGHSTTAITLQYIGLTSEEIESAYLELNLGAMKKEYKGFSLLTDSACG